MDGLAARFKQASPKETKLELQKMKYAKFIGLIILSNAKL